MSYAKDEGLQSPTVAGRMLRQGGGLDVVSFDRPLSGMGS
jgi:hypothetical protein